MLKSGKLLIVKDYVYHIKLQFERFVISQHGLKRFFQKVILDNIPILILFYYFQGALKKRDSETDCYLWFVNRWSTTSRFKIIGEYSILRTFISVHLIDSYMFNEWLGYFPWSYSDRKNDERQIPFSSDQELLSPPVHRRERFMANFFYKNGYLVNTQ